MRSLPLLRIALVSTLLAFAACTSLPDKTPIQTGPVSVTGEDWRATDQVILITDASGTMWMERTFPDAKALTQSFVSALPAADAPAAHPGNYNTGLIGFGGDDRSTVPLSAFDRSRLSSTATSLEVMGDINGMGGRTPYSAVLTETRAQLAGKSGRAAVVIFSDGVPDNSDAGLYAGQLLVRSYPDVCIHAVQTGDDPEGYAFLNALTSMTSCGSFRTASAIGSGAEVQQFARAVMITPGIAPVAAGPGPCAGVIRMRGIEFEFDRDAIQSGSRPVLDVAVEQLSGCPDIRITIGGHTDAIGAEAYNEGLSGRRAEATRQYFIDKGISPGRLEARGYGESQPVASNDSADGRAQNRRVELSPAR